jgi:hypothetical protein
LRQLSLPDAQRHIAHASELYAELGDGKPHVAYPMTEKATAEQSVAQGESKVLDATSVLAASVKREKAIKRADIELIELLESTILRVDASNDACEKAAAAIMKLASSRSELGMEIP